MKIKVKYIGARNSTLIETINGETTIYKNAEMFVEVSQEILANMVKSQGFKIEPFETTIMEDIEIQPIKRVEKRIIFDGKKVIKK